MSFHIALLCMVSSTLMPIADAITFHRTKRSSDIPKFCFDPPETGFCEAGYRKYFYNPVTRECEPFIWSGCGGNDNRFWTQHDCEVVCKSNPSNEDDISSLQIFDTLIEGKDDCEYPPETGRCRAFFPRFYFDGTKCDFFVWGGCGGNPNNFVTEEACLEKCMPESLNKGDEYSLQIFDTLIEGKDDCEYPPETGRCRAFFPRFYFDGTKCDFFVWGGCGGNPNNFETEEACIERCMPGF